MNSLIDEIPVFLSFTNAYISSLLQVLKIHTSNTSEKAFNAFNDSVIDWSGILNFSRTSTGAVR